MYLKRQRDPGSHRSMMYPDSAISQIDFWTSHGHEMTAQPLAGRGLLFRAERGAGFHILISRRISLEQVKAYLRTFKGASGVRLGPETPPPDAQTGLDRDIYQRISASSKPTLCDDWMRRTTVVRGCPNRLS
jgi:hypothetical protein